MMEMYDYFKKIIDDLRANPNDTLASVIANARINGELLPDRDVFGYFNITATAGHDTTSYALTGGMLALLQNPGELAKLRADPALMPLAVEEILRWTTPVKHFCRTAVERLRGCRQAGQGRRPPAAQLSLRAALTRRSTKIPSPSASTAAPIATWPSAPARTSALASTWRGSNCPRSSANCSTGSSISNWPARRALSKAALSAGSSTCRSATACADPPAT